MATLAINTDTPSPAPARTAPRLMSLRESLYLDIVRTLAAIVVVLDHAQDLFQLDFLPRFGHHAVILFFVLSGYVISYVADTREHTASKFIIARLARLWSVLVPAVLLTLILDFIGAHYGFYPETYAHTPFDWPLIRIIAALGFLSETWVSITFFSNVALWSLSVEFWYYMLFAAWTFAPSRRWRIALVLLAVLFTGYKGLLLLPVWLTGVALQRWRGADQLRPSVSTALFLGCGLLIVIFFAADIYPLAWGHWEAAISPWLFATLGQARLFWLDWIFGIVVAGHLIGARYAVRWIPLDNAAGAIRWSAGISFAMYLLHAPLLHFCRAYIPASAGILALILTFIAIAAIGRPIELSKRAWLRALEAAWNMVYSGYTRRRFQGQASSPVGLG